ncbi:MAG: AbrB/MazE/SpoVT family DNA-binding domain-containing protein [Candidatus Methanoperedens sp.]|nr:AbrB/MazE/SpoVT family DNA-binding domain-containing protein [Candidatus Methanoperedens sp.]MCZ7361049.1 AbrB/MazE/SpoVT family DNA-binding domain-containing protein [Candidatus Methanoperedens sp.]HLB71416.1 AbrB/MazE/SpoVT family DNA-binding domain-containing protein [Candidatus Methanoperedens sp.]
MKSKRKIVGITSKGQATIPAEMRRRYKLKKRVLIADTDKGLLILPAPEPEDEMGSLKGLFDMKAEELLREARKKDKKREKALEEL